MIDLDGTANKGKLGANAILGVSLAVANAAAASADLPLYKYLGGPNAHVLPVPMMNILNGGSHADSDVDIQEFMIVPIGAETFSEGLRWGVEVYHTLKSVLQEQGPVHRPGRRGRLRPEPAVQPRRPGPDPPRPSRTPATPRARTSPWPWTSPPPSSSRTAPTSSKARHLSATEMSAYYAELVADYPLVSIEDPLDENDWEGWKHPHRRHRRQGPAGGRRPVRHQPGAPAARHRHQDRQLAAGQGQPDRLPDRDPGRRLPGPARRLHHHHLAPLRRNRGHHHRRHLPSPPTPARSRPAPRPAPSAWPSTTSCCASKRNSTTPHATPDAAPSRVSTAS